MIRLSEIVKRYIMGDVVVEALRGVTLEINDGEFVAIMGPSGSGKSTLMNIVGCLDTPTSGSYELDGIEVSQLNDDELAAVRSRKIGFVFQSFNLLPRVEALKQVELPLMYQGVRDRRQRAITALDAVGLADRIHHKPRELSGGQQQRVAIARALATPPGILLMDEPFGALDAITRSRMQAELLRIQRGVRTTIVFVTHDVDEAFRLGSLIAIMSEGRLVQAGTPVELLTRPADDFVRRLIGTDAILRQLPPVELPTQTTASPATVTKADQAPLLRDFYLLLSFAAREPIPLTSRGMIPKRPLVRIVETLRHPEGISDIHSEEDLGWLPFLRALAEQLGLLAGGPGELVLRNGVRATSILRTLLDVGQRLDLVEAVVIADMAEDRGKALEDALDDRRR